MRLKERENTNISQDFKMMWKEIQAHYRCAETDAVQKLIENFDTHVYVVHDIRDFGISLIGHVRSQKLKAMSIEQFLQTHKLSTQEGLAMMCLAEALLRIPDAHTKTKLIRDKTGSAGWENESDDALVAKLTNIGFSTSHKLLSFGENYAGLFSTFSGLIRRFSAPVIRTVMVQAIRIMGQQFVMGETIDKALVRARLDTPKGYLHSFDMLGEAALTQADADRYLLLYKKALETIAIEAESISDFDHKPTLSVKLSALHPRYDVLKKARVMDELLPKMMDLCRRAKELRVGITLDAEESERLTLMLEIVQTLMTHPDLKEWEGLGIAVQAYQKRAPYVLDFLIELAQQNERKLNIRLVKGAYWDSEIKRTQQNGLSNYALFTKKTHTDVSYLACAQKLLRHTTWIYPQFATHNAQTLSAIYHMAQQYGTSRYEFQRLHGMGEPLFDAFLEKTNRLIPCRVYAPVGEYRDLLAYLVRRLLENGANSSFVNQLYDADLSLNVLLADPIQASQLEGLQPHAKISLPAHLYGDRLNSRGFDLSNEDVLKNLMFSFEKMGLFPDVTATPPETLERVFDRVYNNRLSWEKTSVVKRAECLENLAKLLDENYEKLLFLLLSEGHKTIADSVSEVREAIDFCIYYAQQARLLMEHPLELKGPTGELNVLSYHARGVFVCISPWNFPLAIFLGQVVAALVTGNSVIAKPAESTPMVALFAVELAYKAGIPRDVLQLVIASGSNISQKLLTQSRLGGVTFTGSTHTSLLINRTLAERYGPIIPLMAETGGMNAMIVDSSALAEQVVQDVIASGFQSAGQRCSALRILCLQSDIADHVIEMLVGAMKELKIGNPFDFSADIGPVIDAYSKDTLLNYLDQLSQNPNVKKIYACDVPEDTDAEFYVAPQLWEVGAVSDVVHEAFGPIVHVVRYRGEQIERIMHDINQTGYGLTFGLHTRLESTIQTALSIIKAGNIYVNRSTIGAVVGVQPFGGEGLSGTGPKAGGPNYLRRFVCEKTFTHNITAAGGNASLLADL